MIGLYTIHLTYTDTKLFILFRKLVFPYFLVVTVIIKLKSIIDNYTFDAFNLNFIGASRDLFSHTPYRAFRGFFAFTFNFFTLSHCSIVLNVIFILLSNLVLPIKITSANIFILYPRHCYILLHHLYILQVTNNLEQIPAQ